MGRIGWTIGGAVLATAATVSAATLYSGGGSTNGTLRAIDPTNAATLSAIQVTIGDTIAGAITGLVNDPQTGTLFGVVRDLRCADPARTAFVEDCGDVTTQEACAISFERRSGHTGACAWAGGSCGDCPTGSTAPNCLDTCYIPPTCPGDPTLTLAGVNACYQFDGNQAGCESAFTDTGCGPSSCRWADGQCETCGPLDAEEGICTNACGPYAPVDKIHLATIDPTTGVATSRGDLGDRFAALAFTCDGRLFGVTGDGACGDADTLYAIDPSDASKEKLAQFGNDNDGETLAFNPLDGLLYYASGDDGPPGVLYQSIDPDTLATTPLTFDTLLDDEEVQAMCWSEVDQAFLWKQFHGPGPIYRLSPDGQTVTTIGTTDHQAKGLAFAEPIAACIACGDGLLAFSEGCDDGNTTARDCCSAGCTVEDDGFPGAACELGNLLDPNACGQNGIEAKTAAIVAKRGGKIQVLAGKAEEAAGAGDTKKAAKRLKAAGKQIKKLTKVLAKREAKTGADCTAALQAILERLTSIVGGISIT